MKDSAIKYIHVYIDLDMFWSQTVSYRNMRTICKGVGLEL